MDFFLEEELLSLLPISQQCNSEEADVILLLYKSKLKKYHAPTKMTTPLDFAKNTKEHFLNYHLPNSILDVSTPAVVISTPNDESTCSMPKIQLSGGSVKRENNLNLLNNSLYINVAQAEKYYYDCDYQQCSILTEKVLKQDPYHMACLPIHISCQVELKESNSM